MFFRELYIYFHFYSMIRSLNAEINFTPFLNYDVYINASVSKELQLLGFIKSTKMFTFERFIQATKERILSELNVIYFL